MPDFLFQNWSVLARTLVVGVVGYIALIAILRISGKRTLAKMNAFDFVVTVALGSTLASILISPQVALAEGILALFLLIALQYGTAWTSARYPPFKRIVTAEPTLLLRRGQILHEAMRRERVAEMEIHQAARQQGFASLADLEAIVLESDGTFSVLGKGGTDRSTIAAVPRYESSGDGDGHQQQQPASDRQRTG